MDHSFARLQFHHTDRERRLISRFEQMDHREQTEKLHPALDPRINSEERIERVRNEIDKLRINPDNPESNRLIQDLDNIYHRLSPQQKKEARSRIDSDQSDIAIQESAVYFALAFQAEVRSDQTFLPEAGKKFANMTEDSLPPERLEFWKRMVEKEMRRAGYEIHFSGRDVFVKRLQNVATDLHRNRASQSPVDAVANDASGVSYRKNSPNEWVSQGLDTLEVKLTDSQMDARVADRAFDVNNDAQFKERIKDLPPLAQGILTFLRDIVRLLQGIKTDKEPINSQADLGRRTKALDTAREGIEKKMQTATPEQRKALIKQRNELSLQQRTANDQFQEVGKHGKELAVDIKRLAIEEGLDSIETGAGVDGIRIRGTSAEVKGLYSRIKGTDGAWMAIVGADGDPSQICEVRIPLSKLSLLMLTPGGRGQQVMEGQRIDRREVSKPDWERVFPYKEFARSGATEMLIVSFPPQLAERAMNLPKNSTDISSILISNSAPFPVDLYGKNENSQGVARDKRQAPGADYTNLQKLAPPERLARQQKMQAETQVRMALGIRVENTAYGTKITVPGKLRGKGIKIDGINVV